MKGRLIDLAVGLDGRQRVTISIVGDFREQFDALKDSDINVEIKKYHRRRSLDANAYAWVLIDKLAEAMKLTKEEVYREAVLNIGGVSQVVCVQDNAVEKLREGWHRQGIGWQTDTMPSKIPGCTNVLLYYGSSMYDTKQMSSLIDLLVMECKELGIETATPAELALLKEGWR